MNGKKHPFPEQQQQQQERANGLLSLEGCESSSVGGRGRVYGGFVYHTFVWSGPIYSSIAILADYYLCSIQFQYQIECVYRPVICVCVCV